MASEASNTDTVPSLYMALREHWTGSWKLHLFRGILALILGLLAILFPVPTLFAVTLVFAAYVLVDGVLALMAGVRKDATYRQGQRHWPFVLYGLLGLTVGVVFLIWPLVATIAFAFTTLAIVVTWAIGGGILELRAGLWARRHTSTGWLLVLSGALSILLGAALMLFFWVFPAATLQSVAWMIGIYALIYGAILVMMAVRIRRERRKEETDEFESRPSAA